VSLGAAMIGNLCLHVRQLKVQADRLTPPRVVSTSSPPVKVATCWARLPTCPAIRTWPQTPRLLGSLAPAASVNDPAGETVYAKEPFNHDLARLFMNEIALESPGALS
jgi:hypothetical protein